MAWRHTIFHEIRLRWTSNENRNFPLWSTVSAGIYGNDSKETFLKTHVVRQHGNLFFSLSFQINDRLARPPLGHLLKKHETAWKIMSCCLVLRTFKHGLSNCLLVSLKCTSKMSSWTESKMVIRIWIDSTLSKQINCDLGSRPIGNWTSPHLGKSTLVLKVRLEVDH